MEFNKNQPIYNQIADLICEKILSGTWKEGERILSVREFAGEIQVNPNTVMRAFSFLQDAGIITNQRGIGFFVTDSGINKAREFILKEVKDYDMKELFRKMLFLNISIEELRHEFEAYCSRENGRNHEKIK